MGLYTYTDIKIGNRHIGICGTYLPARSEINCSGLWSKTKLWLKQRKYNISPVDFIKVKLNRLIVKKMLNPTTSILLMGDFNGGWDLPEGTYRDIKPWIEDMGLERLRGLSNVKTFIRGGRWRTTIDHIFVTPNRDLTEITSWVDQSTHIEQLTDHALLGAQLSIPELLPEYSIRNTRVIKSKPSIQITGIERTKVYHKRLGNPPKCNDPSPEQSERMLEEITLQATKSATSHACHKHRGKNLWSPVVMAHQAKLIALLEIRRYWMGQCHRRRWKPIEVARGILIITDVWIRKVQKIANNITEQ